MSFGGEFWYLRANIWVWWEGWDGCDGRSSKVSFNFLHIILVYRCKYLLIYEIKKCSKISLWLSKFDVKFGGEGIQFLNYPIYVSFPIFGSKSWRISVVSIIFLKISKTFFPMHIWKSSVLDMWLFFLFFFLIQT